MSNRREQIQMSPAEVDGFLDEQRTLIVGTQGSRGYPHLVPMWFALLDGDIVFWTYRSAQKVVNLRRDARMSCLVETGDAYEELRGVLLEGYGRITTDADHVQRIGEAVAMRYGGIALDDTVREHVRRTGLKRVAVTFEQTRVVSWDHRKLGRGVY